MNARTAEAWARKRAERDTAGGAQARALLGELDRYRAMERRAEALRDARSAGNGDYGHGAHVAACMILGESVTRTVPDGV